MSTETGQPIAVPKNADLHPVYDVNTMSGMCGQCFRGCCYDRFRYPSWIFDFLTGIMALPIVSCAFLRPSFSNFELAGYNSAELCMNVSMPVVCCLRFGLCRQFYSDSSKDYKGRGAMHGSALYGNWLTTVCLVKCCCFDLNPLDDDGKTPLDLSQVFYDAEFDRGVRFESESSIDIPARKYISYTGRKVVSLFLSKVGGKTSVPSMT